jgi:hypothetical protein
MTISVLHSPESQLTKTIRPKTTTKLLGMKDPYSKLGLPKVQG